MERSVERTVKRVSTNREFAMLPPTPVWRREEGGGGEAPQKKTWVFFLGGRGEGERLCSPLPTIPISSAASSSLHTWDHKYVTRATVWSLGSDARDIANQRCRSICGCRYASILVRPWNLWTCVLRSGAKQRHAR